jgi:hypothetical protein
MPVKHKKDSEGKCYAQWGNQTKYYYPCDSNIGKENAERKAQKQGSVIEISRGLFESYNDYPKAASENACKVLRWIDEHGRDEVKGMTQTGLARANQLCKRENISRDTIARMAAFERHRKNSEIDEKYKGTPWKDKGYVSWLGWGGTEGIEWAQRKLEQIDREENFSCSCGRDLEEHIKEIEYDFSLTPEQKKQQIEDLTNYNDFIERIERDFDFDSIGKEYQTNESDLLHFYSIPNKDFRFRVINLYKYEPQPGSAPIIDTTRRFCAQLYLRTQNENNYLTFSEIQSLSNPGSRYGVSDILRYCGNFTTNLNYTTCRHRWIRYKYDTETGNIVRDVTQPLYAPTISKG